MGPVHENFGSLHFPESRPSRVPDGHCRRHYRRRRRGRAQFTRLGASGYRRARGGGPRGHGPAHRCHRHQPHDLPTGDRAGKGRRLCRRDGKACQGNARSPAEDRLDGRCQRAEVARRCPRVADALFRGYPRHGGDCWLIAGPGPRRDPRGARQGSGGPEGRYRRAQGIYDLLCRNAVAVARRRHLALDDDAGRAAGDRLHLHRRGHAAQHAAGAQRYRTPDPAPDRRDVQPCRRQAR